MPDGDFTKPIRTLGPRRPKPCLSGIQTQEDRLKQACETHCQDEWPCTGTDGEEVRLW
jgi:hypothetical protein